MKGVLRAFPGWLLLLLIGCASVPSPGTQYAPSPAERQLAILIERRLSYSYEVAWFKYQRQLPIADAGREAAVIRAMEQAGAAKGLSASTVSAFFAAQIAASREFQQEVMQAWNQGRALPRSSQVDLERDIRPRILEVSREMIALLADPSVKTSPGLAAYVYEFLRAREYSPNVADVASAPLK